MENLIKAIALGDSLGLPAEGLSRKQVRHFHRTPIKQSYLFGKGFYSDDTELALVTLRALPGDDETFHLRLRQQLVRWVFSAPVGIGVTTLKACFRLAAVSQAQLTANKQRGLPSAGNGPLIRALVIGASGRTNYCALTEVSTHLTHTAPEATICCAAIAEIAAQACGARKDKGQFSPRALAQALDNALEAATRDPRKEISAAAADIESLAKSLHSFSEGFVDLAGALKEIGCEDSVSPYIVHTLLGAVLIAMAHQNDPNEALDVSIRVGGDTDSTAAIVAGLIYLTSAEPLSFDRLRLWNTRPTTRFSDLDPANPWLHLLMIILGIPLLIRKNLARLRSAFIR
jgi:ADP-ribosylglycohydrolase